MRLSCHRRQGFTLVELLVVIGILAVLFALTALYFVTFGKSHNVNRGADQVSQWLLVARQQARRDGRPTGIRFLVPDAKLAPNGTELFCTEMQYIQQPDDFAQGVYIGRVEQAPFNVARILTPLTTDLLDASVFPVADGDYFEIYNGGLVRRITLVSPATSPVTLETTGANYKVFQVTLNPAGPPLPDSPAAYTPAELQAMIATNPPTNYRIIPQPRPISGESSLKLPEDVAIDFNTRTWNTYTTGGYLSNPPTRTIGNATVPEILFAPSGAVIGQNTTASLIFLWVRRATIENGQVVPDNSTQQTAGYPVLIAVQPRTGFIAAHPIPGSGDPYLFARDGKSSGM